MKSVNFFDMMEVRIKSFIACEKGTNYNVLHRRKGK
ncbi:hypothetical protein EYF80_066045 [Liparis tanakae]|uniref:Uncharacterized protein n=1 Tax=Liparis tanakae TaxID=230148 RepID=A0A4Z2E5E3_9TELE|nr:hypothetical protein EYF80_066045 [Liparis tanakae]